MAKRCNINAPAPGGRDYEANKEKHGRREAGWDV